jgi:hypothetical protein
MSDDPVVVLRDLSQPVSSHPKSLERNVELLSSSPGSVDLELAEGGAPISSGTLVGVQTSETIYMGHVESGQMHDNRYRFRVHVDHWLVLEDVAAIQKIWKQEQAD